MLLTRHGATITHEIDAAAESPAADLGFYGLIALIGIYVGIIPVAIGMLWLPWLREVDPRWLRFLLASHSDCWPSSASRRCSRAASSAGDGPQSLGGAALVWIGAAAAYLALAGADAWLRGRGGEGAAPARSRAQAARLCRAALLVAVGIGLHNLGEGLAIGSAYAVGSLALGPPSSWGSRFTTPPRDSRSSPPWLAVAPVSRGSRVSVCWPGRRRS